MTLLLKKAGIILSDAGERFKFSKRVIL